MPPTRRSLLQTLGAATALAATGCQTTGSADDGASTPAPTDPRTPEPPDPTATPASTPDRDAKDVLPEPGETWSLVGTFPIDAKYLGGETGIVGKYDSPEGTRFRAIVLEQLPRHDPTRSAERWACIGWDVAVAYEDFAFAAGTGTEQRNYTPETPPHMDQTAIPGSAERSRELLARSPLLSAATVEADAVTCEG